MANGSRSDINSSDLYLSPEQQDLLLAALSSNKPSPIHGGTPYQARTQNAAASQAQARNPSQPQSKPQAMSAVMGGGMQYVSPVQQTPGSAELDGVGLDESPFIDFGLEDGNFDWDDSGDQLIGNIPGTSSNGDETDLHDKRKNPDDDKDEEEGGGKRREGDEKSSKKPGRKPLTSEPTSKRKAQNRAAQRAFRERKERHLKDLETKVEELEKASESANHENGLLRAQVEQLQAELKSYRNRLSLNSNAVAGSPTSLGAGRPSSTANKIDNMNNFQFEFPKFGSLPGSQLFSVGPRNSERSQTSTYQSNGAHHPVPGVVQRDNPESVSPKTASQKNGPGSTSPPNTSDLLTSQRGDGTSGANVAKGVPGIFSSSILQTLGRGSSFDYSTQKDTTKGGNRTDRGSTGSSNSQTHIPQLNGGSMSSDTTSPSASSVSQHGPGSSCETSPEPGSYSPANTKVGENGLNTINEEHPNGEITEGGQATKALTEINGIDWMAQQNGGQFDPALFGDYRDPQDAVLSNDFGGFFDDAFALPDLGASNFYSYGDTASPVPKADLSKETLENKINEAPKDVAAEKTASSKRPAWVTCGNLWEQLQNSPAYQNGELDIDSLCTELKQKAVCSETGIVVDQNEVEDVLRRHHAR